MCASYVESQLSSVNKNHPKSNFRNWEICHLSRINSLPYFCSRKAPSSVSGHTAQDKLSLFLLIQLSKQNRFKISFLHICWWKNYPFEFILTNSYYKMYPESVVPTCDMKGFSIFFHIKEYETAMQSHRWTPWSESSSSFQKINLILAQKWRMEYGKLYITPEVTVLVLFMFVYFILQDRW